MRRVDGKQSMVFLNSVFIYHVVLGDHLPWRVVAMEKPAFPHIWGLLSLACILSQWTVKGLGGGHSVCRSIKNKRETRGAPSILGGISFDLVLFPESAAV